MRQRFRTLSLLVLALLSTLSNAGTVGGDFNLTTADGKPYALHDSLGKAVVLSFGYTHCPDVCPTALATIGAALKQLGDQASEVDARFITLDPQRDTPEVLQTYTRFFHPSIEGLTGSAQALKQVADQYRVRYQVVGEPNSPNYSLDHTANLYVIGPEGKLQRIIPHGMPPSVLADNLREVLSAKMAHQPVANN